MLKCVLCSELLPQGGRRDRRYCREACRVMAYRQRRDSKPAASSRSETAAMDSQSTRQSQEFFALSQQVAELVRELAEAKKRIAVLEAHSQVQSAPIPGSEKRAGWAEVIQTVLQESLSRRQSAGPATVAPTASTAPPPSGTASKQYPSAGTSNQAPWMVARPDAPGVLVPKWTLWSTDYLNTVDRLAERTLAGLPELMVRHGRPDMAQPLQKWMISEAHVLPQIAVALARRIVATTRPERQSDEQRLQVASWAVQNLTDSIPCRDPVEKQRFESVLSSNSERVLLVGTCLAVVVRTLDDLPDKRSL